MKTEIYGENSLIGKESDNKNGLRKQIVFIPKTKK